MDMHTKAVITSMSHALLPRPSAAGLTDDVIIFTIESISQYRVAAAIRFNVFVGDAGRCILAPLTQAFSITVASTPMLVNALTQRQCVRVIIDSSAASRSVIPARAVSGHPENSELVEQLLNEWGTELTADTFRVYHPGYALPEQQNGGQPRRPMSLTDRVLGKRIIGPIP